jgi:hypothetical protein
MAIDELLPEYDIKSLLKDGSAGSMPKSTIK